MGDNEQQKTHDNIGRDYKFTEANLATEFEAAKLQGLGGLLSSFVNDFKSFFKTRTSSVLPQAEQFLRGLIQTRKRRNIERIHEDVPGVGYDSLHHFTSQSPWDELALDREVSRRADQSIGDPNATLIVDPSCFAKKGIDSVGVGRMWNGRLGKKDNSQKGVFASLAKGKYACLIDKLLYLPKEWIDDPDRCEKAGIPEDQRVYRSDQQLALQLVKNADLNGVRYGWLGLDAEFAKPWLLQEFARMGKRFTIDLPCNFSIYPTNPKIHKKPKLVDLENLRFVPKSRPVGEWLRELRGKRWRKLKIRESTKGMLEVSVLRKSVWFWPKAEKGETRSEPMLMQLIVRRDLCNDGYKYKYSLSNATPATSTKKLAYQQAQRFWVEQSIKDCKQDAGMAEYQVRSWRGWHHHVSMSILASLFMLEIRLKHKDDIPLLSMSDIRELLTTLLSAKNSYKERIQQMKKRHRQRGGERRIGPD